MIYLPGVSENVKGRIAAARLCDVIERRLEEILARWESKVRTLHPARHLSETALRDFLPQILERIAAAVKAVHEGVRVSTEELPDSHALARLDEGFDLEEVAAEFALLRKTIVEVWQEEVGGLVGVEEVSRLNEAIDQAVAVSVARFAASRERTLKALDRISAAALGTGDVDSFLTKLIQVLQETTEAVDAVVILLREGDRLRVRAAVGMAGEKEMFELRVGESFAGRIASERRPAALRVVDSDMRFAEREALLRN